MERLSTVFLNKYPDRIEFYSFSDPKVALQCVQSGKVEVFLANEQFEVNVADIPENTCFAYIAENAETEEIHGQRTIFKYQRAETFYKQILDFYAENTTKVISGYSSNHQNTTEVISIRIVFGRNGLFYSRSGVLHLCSQTWSQGFVLKSGTFRNDRQFLSWRGTDRFRRCVICRQKQAE